MIFNDLNKLIDECVNTNKDIYICGKGITGKRCSEWLSLHNIQCDGFIDKKRGGCFLYSDIGKVVDKDSFFLVVSRNYKREMEKDLLVHGVNEKNIFDLTLMDVQEKMIYELNRKISCSIQHMRWEKFKNKYAGKRCFIVGNGPSLQIEDLKKLSNDVSFMTNTIYSVFENIGFKPTFYVLEDMTAAEKCFTTREDFEWLLENTENVFCSKKNVKYREYSQSDYKNLYFYNLIESREGFSLDINDKIYGYGTTVFSMYQMAFYMGFKEIYLIGMDCSFNKVINDDGEVVINENILTNPEFMHQIDDDPALYNLNKILLAHAKAKSMADSHGIKIYNATRGGKLEVFERVDFDSLFEEK